MIFGRFDDRAHTVHEKNAPAGEREHRTREQPSHSAETRGSGIGAVRLDQKHEDLA